jgi:glutathione S-transferase
VPFFIKPVTRKIGSSIEDNFLTRSLTDNFKFLEDQLASSPDGGEYFCGKEPSAADIMLIYPLEAAMEGKLVLSKETHPKIAAWLDRVHERPAYKAAITKSEELTGEKFSLLP